MKKVVFCAAWWALAAIGVRAIEVTSVEFIGASDSEGSNVTVVARVTGFADRALMFLEVRDTNNFGGQYFAPEVVYADGGMCVWTNTDWVPYFTGEHLVHVRALDLSNAGEDVLPTNTTIVRTIGGAINSVQVAADSNAPYSATMAFTNIDCLEVFLANTGVYPFDTNMYTVGCSLWHSYITYTPGMTDEQADLAYADTADYRPAGTPFRFDASLHARPTSIMCFGELKRFAWTPINSAAPAGPGRLVVDVISCSPWRHGFTTNHRAHVGFAPLFVTDASRAKEIAGCLMSTTAHYLDVSPTNNPGQSRLGLLVNGQSNTTSYLKMFLPDTQLERMGLTNFTLATNALMGYVTHFNAGGQSKEDTAAVPPIFAPVVGGTNIIYDYEGAGQGQAGLEARFTFVFESPVAAEMGPTGETPDSGFSWIEGDFDGDRKADPAIYYAAGGAWRVLRSSAGYQAVGLSNFGGLGWTGMAADYDGDGLADLAIYHAASGVMKVKLSSEGYGPITPVSGLGGSGYHLIPGDYDGDRKADPAVNQSASGSFAVRRSDHSYAQASFSSFGGPAWTSMSGDFDGDLYTDFAIYNPNAALQRHWMFLISSRGYLLYDDLYLQFGHQGYTPVTGDYDGDGKTDLALYRAATGHWYFALSTMHYLSYQHALGGAQFVAVTGDFDGDGQTDPAVINTTSGLLTVAVSSLNHAHRSMALLPAQ